MKILCSGHLVRHPLGGHTWHHLQYLLGFARMGHEVAFFEHFGWPGSCYDAARDEMTGDPSAGIAYLLRVFDRMGLKIKWCFLSEDGQSHGMPRSELAQFCRECDVYFNLSNLNWIDELKECRRRVLIDTDPVFTQIGAHGVSDAAAFHRHFTFGENVHRHGCSMPAGRANWLPTRQPVVLDVWPVAPADPESPLTTLINWTAYGATVHQGCEYGQKDQEFQPYFDLPRRLEEPMEIGLAGPDDVRNRLVAGGWKMCDPLAISRDPWTYQQFIAGSRGEFCVAKHAYVTTRCGWFSDRSTAYLAMGRPVVLQDTGYSDVLPCGKGLLPYRTPDEAAAAIRSLREDYPSHCRAARAVVEACFDSNKVLDQLLKQSVS